MVAEEPLGENRQRFPRLNLILKTGLAEVLDRGGLDLLQQIPRPGVPGFRFEPGSQHGFGPAGFALVKQLHDASVAEFLFGGRRLRLNVLDWRRLLGELCAAGQHRKRHGRYAGQAKRAGEIPHGGTNALCGLPLHIVATEPREHFRRQSSIDAWTRDGKTGSARARACSGPVPPSVEGYHCHREPGPAVAEGPARETA